MDQCSDCRFWLNWDSEGANLGECHRFPPRMATVHRIGVEGEAAVTIRPEDGGWPLTAPDDWCGEFQRPPVRGGESPPSPEEKAGDVGPAGI